MNILKKSAYIKGYMEGLDIDKNTNEGKVLNKMMDLLEEICEEINEVNEDVSQIWEVIDEIDENLQDIEEDVCGCGEEYNDCFCVKCPECGKEYYMRYSELNEEELKNGEIKCPGCHCSINIDKCLVDEECCDCGCEKFNCDCEEGNCECDK